SLSSRALPSQKRKLQPPVCRLRKPLTQSRPVRLSPKGSWPLTVGVHGRRFIGSSRGLDPRPYWAVTAQTQPCHGWLALPTLAALHDCSISAGWPVASEITVADGLLRLRTR